MSDAPAGTSPHVSRRRIEAVSDGVFAIALTLLTLNVRLDQGPHEPFGHALHETLPQLFAYAISFAVIALFWISHHRLFESLVSADHGLVVFNFVFLGVVALVPFPSQVLGASSEVGAVVLYACVLLAACLVSSAMWLYARQRGLLDPAIPARLVVHSVLRGLVLAAAFAISIPVAIFVGPHAGEWTWLVGVPARFLLSRRYGAVHDVEW